MLSDSTKTFLEFLVNRCCNLRTWHWHIHPAKQENTLSVNKWIESGDMKTNGKTFFLSSRYLNSTRSHFSPRLSFHLHILIGVKNLIIISISEIKTIRLLERKNREKKITFSKEAVEKKTSVLFSLMATTVFCLGVRQARISPKRFGVFWWTKPFVWELTFCCWWNLSDHTGYTFMYVKCLMWDEKKKVRIRLRLAHNPPY